MQAHRSPRLWTAVLLLVAVVLALPTYGRTQTAPTLRVAATANDSYAEGYYAQELGFFKKAGLDVALQTFVNGAAVSTAVAAGAADIGISNPLQLAGAISRGAPFTLIAGGGMYSSKTPTTDLCVSVSSPLRTAKDLDGKTIAVSALKDITQAAVVVWLSQNGGDPSKVSFVEMPFAEMGPAVARGTVDAAVLVEPSLTLSKQNGLVRVFAHVFDVIAPQFLIGSWFTTTSFAQSHPAVVKQFQNVVYEAGRWANANHARSAAVLSKYSKINLSTVMAMTRVTYPLSLNPQIVQPQLDIAYKTHILEKPVSAADIIFRP
jgi:NitT/TauT family transport system substrate-binding protein